MRRPASHNREKRQANRRQANRLDYVLAAVIFGFIFIYVVTGKAPLQDLLQAQSTDAQAQDLTPVTFYQDRPAHVARQAEPPATDNFLEEPAPIVTRHHAAIVPRNCAEARARGIAPIYSHEPEYGAHMDSDNDGIACEPYRGR